MYANATLILGFYQIEGSNDYVIFSIPFCHVGALEAMAVDLVTFDFLSMCVESDGGYERAFAA